MAASSKGIGFLAWLMIIFLLELFFLAALLPIQLLQKAGEQEQAMTIAFLGEDTAENLKKKTDDFYDSAFNQTGMVKESFNLFIPTKEDQAKSKGLEKMGSTIFKYAEERIIAFWTAVYLAVHRVISLLIWLPAFLPVLVAAAFDSLAIRKIRMLTFSAPSVMVFGISKTAVSAMLIGPAIYAMLPFPIPPVIAPLWCGVFVIAIASMMKNWQRN